MTTFEITIIVLVAAIVVLLILVFTGMATTHVKMKEGFECLAKKIEYCDSKLGYIKGAAQDISQQLDNIEDNNDEDFEKLTDIVDKMHRNLCVEIADKMVDRIYPDKESMNKIDWDKLSKEQQDEFLKRLILPNYDKPTQPIYTPCYAPDGICSNPFGDCINCPKRGTGGTWSTNTSIKAEDAPLQERFNDNKED